MPPPAAGGSAPGKGTGMEVETGHTHLTHLDPTSSNDRAAPSGRRQCGARIPRGQAKGTGTPKHWESLGTSNG